MGWFGRIIERVLGVTEAAPVTSYVDPDEADFRLISGSGGNILDPSNLSDVQMTRVRRQARLNYFRNSLGGALVDVLLAKVFGSGFSWRCTDEDVEKILDKFAKDPDNMIPEYAELYALELLVFGEVCLPIFVTPGDASVRLGYLLPDRIEDVIWMEGDEKKPIAVLQRRASATDKKYLWIIPHPDPFNGNRYPPHPLLKQGGSDNPDGSGDSEYVKDLRGDPVQLPTGSNGEVPNRLQELLNSGEVQVAGYAFYHRHLSMVSGRGHSVYERVFDWIKALDDFMFGILRNAILQGYFIYQVVLKGANKEKLAERKKELGRLPKPGTIILTNESEEWKPQTANPPNASAIEHITANALKFTGMGIGIAGYEIGAEQDVNRNTATEVRITTTYRAKMVQRNIMRMYGTWFSYVLDQKRYVGLLSENADTKVEMVLAELAIDDKVDQSLAVYQAAEALEKVIPLRLVTKRDARIFLYQMMALPMPDDDDFLEQLKKEQEAEKGAGLDDAPLLPKTVLNGNGASPNSSGSASQPSQPAQPASSTPAQPAAASNGR